LRLGIGIAACLSQVHAKGLLHKDVKPAHILAEPASGMAALTGFGIAASIPRERQEPGSPEIVVGTPAYMAPEQTGRMNRGVDARSDLYSLGVVLYEALTGRLPFAAADPVELLHHHLARPPVPPAERDPAIPGLLSDLVLKLLAKSPEERYQTARGAEADLRRCLEAWEAQGRLDPFPLAAHDVPDLSRSPGTLHGREAEQRALREAWARAVSGQGLELVLVSGAAGLGKSALVHALRGHVERTRGLFASGKGDPSRRDVPYAALADACRQILRRLLVLPEPELVPWRLALSEAVRPNGRVLAEVLPELELLLGSLPAVPELTPLEARNRFHAVFSRFLGTLAVPAHPLALFLDDLQWLDPATLELLGHLADRADLRHLLLLAACRDPADPSEPCPANRLESLLQGRGAAMHQIALAPLAPDAIVSLAADLLGATRERVEPLARLVHGKTGGDPFFVLQFLAHLDQVGLLAYSPRAGGWTWDLDRIRAEGYTDNVAEFVARKLERMSPECRATLKMLAALGPQAGIGLLAKSAAVPEPRAREQLEEAEAAGLVACQGNRYFFLHDRIREAAYALIPPEDRPGEHLRLARLLARAGGEGERGEAEAFALAGHFHLGRGLLVDPAERGEVRRLDLSAARLAKAASAWEETREYLLRARDLLPRDAWSVGYEEAFAVHLELAESESMTGRREAAEELMSAVLGNARTDLEQARVHRLRIYVRQLAGEVQAAVEAGLEGLRALGIDLPREAAEVQAAAAAETAAAEELLAGRSIAGLALAPEAAENRVKAVLDLIADTLPPVYLGKPGLYPLLILKGLNLSLRHGNTASSCSAYMGYAVLRMMLHGDVHAAREFSEMSLALNEHFHDARRRPAQLIFHGAIVAWIRPVPEYQAVAREGLRMALDVGDNYTALLHSLQLMWSTLRSGEPIGTARSANQGYLELARRDRNLTLGHLIRLYDQFLAGLQGLTRGPSSIEDDTCEEVETLDQFRSVSYVSGPFYYWTLKQIAAYFAGLPEEALDHAEKARALQGSLFTTIIAVQHFYHAIILAALHPRMSRERRTESARTLDGILGRLAGWARNGPESFLCLHALASAEKARIEGRDLEAMRAYEEAAASAHAQGLLHFESLACELAARFYLDRGFDKNAYVHLRDARAGYSRWGAHAKVAQLDRLFPGIEKPAAPGPTDTLGAPLGQLDLANVVKASQAVSGEIETGKLVAKLMGLVMDHAGANRGLLLLPAADGFRVEAEAVLDPQGLAIRQPRTPLAPGQVADGMLRFVQRTRERVILEDAASQGLFTEDEYVKGRKSKAILGLPLLKQSRLLGVLYLENSLAPGVFTPSRVTALEVLASQAAISLENARLFAELEQEKSRLQASEERFAKAFKRNPTPMAIIRSLDWTFVEANERFLRLFGYTSEEIEGHYAMEMGTWFMDLLNEAGKRLAVGGQFRDEEFSAAAKSGEPRVLLASVETIVLGGDTCYLATFVDLTDHKRVEEQLRQSQKMEAIGSLAGGVAHDFNNLLTAINGYSELIMMGMEESDRNYELMSAIRSSGERAAGLTRQLLAFSRKETVRTQVQSLNAIVSEMEVMLRRLIEENVEIKIRLDPEAGSVNVDKGQVVQILMNLVINARDAMRGGGRILVETRRVWLERPTRNTVLAAPPGAYAALTVKDMGTGMTPEVKAKIFEPFFTTKAVGKGTGLGLSVVYGVVKKLGGGIALQSEPGQGTTFCIYFPEVPEAPQTPASEQPGRERMEVYRGSETLLVVEDEDTVRKFLKQVLMAQGYKVLEAPNGVEALRILQQAEQPLDLVVTDLIMPDMGGRELAEQVRVHRPALPVLFTSGYSKDSGSLQEAMANAEYFLSKPFGPLDLARKVREVLERSRQGA
jgi:PAS domain S-box-containing protein